MATSITDSIHQTYSYYDESAAYVADWSTMLTPEQESQLGQDTSRFSSGFDAPATPTEAEIAQAQAQVVVQRVPEPAPQPEPAPAPAPSPVVHPTPPRERRSEEWLEIYAVWDATHLANPYRLYQLMSERGWDVNDLAFVTGRSVQWIADDMTRMGAQAGFGGAETLGRDAVNRDFMAALEAELNRPPPDQPDPSRHGWGLTELWDESGAVSYSATFNMRQFTAWYVSQDTQAARDFSRVHGVFNEALDGSGAVQFASGMSVNRTAGGVSATTGEPAAIDLTWAADPRVAHYQGYGRLNPLDQLAMNMMLTSMPENRDLLEAFGGTEGLPESETAERARAMYGTELATTMYRLQHATEALRARYMEALNTALNEDVSQVAEQDLPPWWSQGEPFKDADGNDSSLRTFHADRFHNWYIQQEGTQHRLMGQLYGNAVASEADGNWWYSTDGAAQMTVMAEAVNGSRVMSAMDVSQTALDMAAVDLATSQSTTGDDLVDLSKVGYLPGLGFVTERQNIRTDGPDFIDRVVPLLAMAALALVLPQLGQAAAQAMGMTTIGVTTTTTACMATPVLTTSGAMVAGAVSGAAFSMVGGMMNGDLNLRNILRGAFAGGLTAGLMQEAMGLEIVSDLGGIGAIGARTTVQGLVQAMVGGSFRDGALAGLATGLSAALSGSILNGINQSLNQGLITPEAAQTARFCAHMMGASVRIVASGAATPGYELAQEFLGQMLGELGTPAPAPALEPVPDEPVSEAPPAEEAPAPVAQPSPAPEEPPVEAEPEAPPAEEAPAPVAQQPSPAPQEPPVEEVALTPVPAPVDQVGNPVGDAPEDYPEGSLPPVASRSLGRDRLAEELGKYEFKPGDQTPERFEGPLTEEQQALVDATGRVYSSQDAEMLMGLRDATGRELIPAVLAGMLERPTEAIASAITQSRVEGVRSAEAELSVAMELLASGSPEGAAAWAAARARAALAVSGLEAAVAASARGGLTAAAAEAAAFLAALPYLAVAGLALAPGNLGPVNNPRDSELWTPGAGNDTVSLRDGLRLVIPHGETEGQLQVRDEQGNWSSWRNGVSQTDPGLDRLRNDPSLEVGNAQLQPRRGADTPTYRHDLGLGREWVQTGPDEGSVRERNSAGEWVVTHPAVSWEDAINQRVSHLTDEERERLGLTRPITTPVTPSPPASPPPSTSPPNDERNPTVPGTPTDGPSLPIVEGRPAQPQNPWDSIITKIDDPTLTGNREGVDYGGIPEEHRWRYNRYLSRREEAGVPPMDPDAWYRAAQTAWQNNISGNSFELQVRGELGLETGPGSKPISIGGYIPDLPVGEKYGVTDVKNVSYLTNDDQLRAFYNHAVENGLSFNLIIWPQTMGISEPLLDQIRSTNGRVIEYDQNGRSFVGVDIGRNGPWRR
jgi:hypothetical protein